jgi:hypothetical protein
MLSRKLSQLSLFCLLFVHTTSWAGLLCDPGCIVEINFTNGGSIEAVEEVVFTFGNSGLVDTGSTSTAYLKDETLTLNIGEILEFSSGGSLNLGDQGNIDFTHLVINTDDSINLVSATDSTRISLTSDQTLEFSGAASVTVQADELALEGSLIIDGSLVLDTRSSSSPGGGSPSENACTLTNTSGSGVSLSSAEIYDLTSDVFCTEISQNIQLPDLEISGVIKDPTQQTYPGTFPVGDQVEEEEKGSSGSFDWLFLGVLFIPVISAAKQHFA